MKLEFAALEALDRRYLARLSPLLNIRIFAASLDSEGVKLTCPHSLHFMTKCSVSRLQFGQGWFEKRGIRTAQPLRARRHTDGGSHGWAEMKKRPGPEHPRHRPPGVRSLGRSYRIGNTAAPQRARDMLADLEIGLRNIEWAKKRPDPGAI